MHCIDDKDQRKAALRALIGALNTELIRFEPYKHLADVQDEFRSLCNRKRELRMEMDELLGRDPAPRSFPTPSTNGRNLGGRRGY